MRCRYGSPRRVQSGLLVGYSRACDPTPRLAFSNTKLVASLGMARPRLVLIIGSPRSGTTWLQSVLGSHPAIATPQETDIFSMFLAPLSQAWDGQRDNLAKTDNRRRKGLSTVLAESEFAAGCRGIVEQMIDAVHRQKPTAEVVIEKSPSHSMCTDVIQRFWPQATFIHVIRDGRDVAASLVAASQSFGVNFAPAEVHRAARMWSHRLRGARMAADAPGGYLEIRYEDLHSNGVATARQAFEACGVSVSDAEIAAILEKNEFGAVAKGVVSPSILTPSSSAEADRLRTEPEGFFRKGQVGGWRDEWSSDDRFAFDDVAGDLLIELGYEPDASWLGTNRRPKPARPPLMLTASRKLRNLAAHMEQRSQTSK